MKGEYLTKVAYILLLRADQALNLDGWGIVLLQLVALSLAGAFVASHVAQHHSRRAAHFAVSVLALNPHVSQWVKAILTDSLFISLVVILSIVLARSIDRRTSPLPPLLLAALSALLRPNGLGVVVGTGTLLITRMRRFRGPVAATSFVLVLGVVLLSPSLQTPGGEENTLAARTYQGLVIWMGDDDVRIAMPEPAGPSDLSNVALARYVITNPVAVLRLGLLRVGWELAQVRPHYPPAVNGVVLVQMLVLYSLAFIGLRRSERSGLGPAVLSLSGGLLLVIAATWAIAEGRFGWALLAMLSPWVGIGLDSLLKRARGLRTASSP